MENEIREYIKSQVDIGDKIYIMIGASREIEGYVVNITDDSISIKTEQGDIRPIKNLVISYCEVTQKIGNQSEVTTDEAQRNTSDVDAKVLDTNGLEIKEKEALFSVAEEAIFDEIDKGAVRELSDICDLIREEDGTELCNQVKRILDMRNYAKKVNEYQIDNSRTKRIIAELKRLMQENSSSSHLNEVLGYIHLELNDQKSALDYYDLGEDYISGFYAADKAGDTERMKEFSFECLEYEKEIIDLYLIRWLLDYAKENKDLLLVRDLCNKSTANATKILLFWFNGSKVMDSLPDKENIFSSSNEAYLVEKLKEQCPEAETNSKPARSLPVNHANVNASDIEYTGELKNFREKEKYGFISYDLGSVFFYIQQINDKELLKQLMLNPTGTYKVKFQLGISIKGKQAADNIRLVESNLPEEQSKEGFIEEYIPFEEFGIIQAKNKTYKFIFESIIDPYLRAYLKESFSYDGIDVRFHVKKLKSKDIACDIEGTMTYDDAKIQSWLNSKLITSEEIAAWEQRKNVKNTDYQVNIEYVPLEKIKPTVGDNLNTSGPTSKAQELYRKAMNLFQAGKGDDETTYRCFESALENGYNENLQTIITNMITICLRAKEDQSKEMLEKAEKLLKSKYVAKARLPEEKYYVMLSQIYSKYGEQRKKDEIIALNNVIKCSKNVNIMLQCLYRKIQIYSGQEESLSEEISVCLQWLNLYNENLTNIPKSTEQRVICIAAQGVVKMKEIDSKYKVNEILQKFIDSNPKAQEILNDDKSTADLENNYSGLIDFNERITLYGKQLLKECNLVDNLDIRQLDKETKLFNGTYEEAKKLAYAKVEKITTQKPNERSKNYLIAARVLYDALNNKENDGFSLSMGTQSELETMFINYVEKSLVSLGDKAVIKNDFDMDTARFYYMESCRYFVSRDQQDWVNAIVRMVLSFFTDRNSIPIEMKDNKNLSINNDLNKCMQKAYTISNYSHFINCLLLLLSNLNKINNQLYSNMAKHLSTSMYFKGSTIDDIYLEIQKYNGEAQAQSCLNTEMFEHALMSAVDKYERLEKNFVQRMNKLRDFNYDPKWLLEISELLIDVASFKPYMCRLDENRLDKAINIVHNAVTFNETQDYEGKINILTKNLDIIEGLSEEILEQPTQYSFELLKGILEVYKEKTENRLNSLYADKPPHISCQIVGRESIKSVNGCVNIRLNIKNEANCQAANSLTMSVQDSADYEVSKETAQSLYLRSNEGQTFSIQLKVKNPDSNVLSLKVGLTYKYKQTIDKEIDARMNYDFSVPLNDLEFFEISNPYKKYVKSTTVEDENMFFGRKEFIDDIVKLIKTGDGELLHSKSIVLYGQKRTGKTSVLHHLTNKIRRVSPTSIIIDVGDISKYNAQSIEIYFPRLIINKLAHEISKNHIDLLEDMNKNGIHLPDYTLMPLDNLTVSTAIFNEFMTDFTHYLNSKPLGTNYNMIILADEFTYLYTWIKKRKLDEDFMKFWKGIINDYGFVSIVIGQDYMPSFVKAYPNPFGAIEQRQVTYLPVDEAIRMIKEPPVKENGHRARFDGDAGERAVREILKLTAGSAFFNMILLDRLMDYLNDNKQAYVTEADINNLLSERLLADPNGLKLTDFESLYSDDGDIEDRTRPKHNVLVLFLLSRCIHKTGQCKKENIMVPDEIPFKDQMSGDRISNVLNKLQSRGVVDVDNNGSYTIRVGLFDEWLYRKCSYEIINDIEDLK